MDPNNINVTSINNFPPDDVEKYDICLVFPTFISERTQPEDGDADAYMYNDSKVLSEAGSMALSNIIAILGEKYVYSFYSFDETRVFVLLRGGLKLLKTKAEAEQHLFLLHADMVKGAAVCGNEEAGISPFVIKMKKMLSTFNPFEYIYARYTSKPDVQQLYYCVDNMKHPFRKSIRIKMINQLLIDSDAKNGTDDVALEYLLHHGTICDYFPLHEETEQFMLFFTWSQWTILPWNQPFELMKDYYGEKICFYFWLLAYLTFYLVIPAVFGGVLFGLEVYWKDLSLSFKPLFSIAVTLWFVVIVHNLRRAQSVQAMKWNGNHTKGIGCEHTFSPLEEDGYTRYQFYGRKAKSHTTGRWVTYFSRHRRRCLYVVSTLVTALCIVLSLAILLVIFALRSQLRNEWSETSIGSVLDGTDRNTNWGDFNQWATSFAISIQVELCNRLYNEVGLMLTKMENHKADADYQEALIVKVMAFRCINTLTSFYFLAFAASRIPVVEKSPLRRDTILFDSIDFGCVGPSKTSQSCLYDLSINLIVVLALPAVLRYLFRYFFPFVIYHYFPSSWDRFCGAGKKFRAVIREDDNTNTYTVDGSASHTSNDENQFNQGYLRGGGKRSTSGFRRKSSWGEREESNSHHSDMGSNASSLVTGVEFNDLKNGTGSTGRSSPQRSNSMNMGARNQAQSTPPRRQSQSQGYAYSPSPLRGNGNLRTDDDEDFVSGDRSPRRKKEQKGWFIQRALGITGEQSKGSNESDSIPYDDDYNDWNDADGYGEEQFAEDYPARFNSLNSHADFKLKKYDVMHQTIMDYSYAITVFLLVTLFGVVLPSAYAAAFILLYIEVQVNAWRMVKVYQRVIPKASENIGIWNEVLELATIAVTLTNASLVLYSLDNEYVNGLQPVYKVCIILASCVIVLLTKGMLRCLAPIEPLEVGIQRQRGQFIARKLIDAAPDNLSETRLNLL